MSETENNEQNETESLLDQIRRWRTDADKGREPELLSARLGSRQYSVAALLERVIDAFVDEHAGNSDALVAAETEAARLKLVLATVDYVLAVESIQMSNEDKATLIRRVYHELFTYGPLDAHFADESITTITIEGANKVAVRHGQGDLETLEPIFEDQAHLRKIIDRLLTDAGANLTPDIPIIETGLAIAGRPVILNIAGPPATIHLSVDIRLHPTEPKTLTDLQTEWSITPAAVELLTALARAEHGIAIVGEAESGKTTLLNALLNNLPQHQQDGLVVIEQARALRPPQALQRFYTSSEGDNDQKRSFASNIDTALALHEVEVMAVDEVRADEAAAIGPLLSDDEVPRQIWALRGPVSGKRLISALGMLARRSGGDPNTSEERVRSLYERLPFLITMRRHAGHIEIYSISEWQFSESSEYPNYVELMTVDAKGLERTGNPVQRTIDLPDDFWSEPAQ